MNLTREHAIAEHRKLYNEMADKIEQSKQVVRVRDFEKSFCVKHNYGNICSHSPVCEYSGGDCKRCPIDWNSSVNDLMCLDMNRPEDDKGIYTLLFEAKTWQEQAKFSRQIANLPEREDI